MEVRGEVAELKEEEEESPPVVCNCQNMLSVKAESSSSSSSSPHNTTTAGLLHLLAASLPALQGALSRDSLCDLAVDVSTLLLKGSKRSSSVGRASVVVAAAGRRHKGRRGISVCVGGGQH